VRDDARVQVGALLDGSVRGQRLFAFARTFTWEAVLRTMKRVRPGWTVDVDPVIEEMGDQGEDLTAMENGPAEELLSKWWGQDWLERAGTR
jgi:hypothetical protein